MDSLLLLFAGKNHKRTSVRTARGIVQFFTLSVFRHNIGRNYYGIVCSVLDIVRNELPLLVAVGAMPISTQLTTGGEVINLNLLDFSGTDGACVMQQAMVVLFALVFIMVVIV